MAELPKSRQLRHFDETKFPSILSQLPSSLPHPWYKTMLSLILQKSFHALNILPFSWISVNKINCHSFINEGRGERKKSSKWKVYLCSCWSFVLFHSMGDGERDKTPKINSAASWMFVMAMESIDFPSLENVRAYKYVYLYSLFMSLECEWKFSYRALLSFDLNKYEFMLEIFITSCFLFSQFSSVSVLQFSAFK